MGVVVIELTKPAGNGGFCFLYFTIAPDISILLDRIPVRCRAYLRHHSFEI